MDQSPQSRESAPETQTSAPLPPEPTASDQGDAEALAADLGTDEPWPLEPIGIDELLADDAGEETGPGSASTTPTDGVDPALSFDDEPATSNYIAFRMAGTMYAVPMERVLELDRVAPITPVPNTPDFVLGVINMHGEITSVIDLRQLFDLPPTNRLEMSRLIKLQNGSGWVTTGAVVDSVQGMRAILADRLEPANAGDGVVTQTYSSEGETIEIVDVDRLLDSDPIRRLTGV